DRPGALVDRRHEQVPGDARAPGGRRVRGEREPAGRVALRVADERDALAIRREGEELASLAVGHEEVAARARCDRGRHRPAQEERRRAIAWDAPEPPPPLLP